ncbi:MAG: PEGA domain-containing protein [Deltaproteobacteria bacterium]|nr:PEGA domain-containing protein [Deltaproteobacteria bacterium]
MSSRFVVTVPLLLVAAATAAPAQAQDVGMEPSVAVIEMYLKGADAAAAPDYSRSIAFSLSSTGRYAVMERDEVASRFKAVLITPVRRLQMERLEAIERLVKEGDQLVYTDPKAAVDVLNRARNQLESIAEGLAANDRLRHEFLKTQMLLARSHLDSGNEPKASDVLREVIRIYGDQLEVTDRDYHPKMVKLFQKVKSQMGDERVAAMSVETTPPGCEVVLDGRPLPGETPREFKGLYAGIHHVQVRCGSRESMIRRVVLKRDATVHLVVDVGFENALTVEGGRLALAFEGTGEVAAYGVQYAAKFGSLVNADVVVLHGFAELGSRAELKARLVDVKKGIELRGAAVPAKTDVVTPSSVKKLVQVLAATEDVKVAAVPATSGGVSSSAPGAHRWYKSWLGWTLTGLGVGGLAAGGGLLGSYLSHRGNATGGWSASEIAEINAGRGQGVLDARQSEADKAITMRTGSVISFAAGGALLAGGIVVFVLAEKGMVNVRDDSSPATPRFAFTPAPIAGGGAMLGTFSF